MSHRPHAVSRRDALRGLLAVGFVPAYSRGADPWEAIREKGRASGLGPFETSETGSFRGIGDAPAAFRVEALGVCEAVAAEYRKHFTRKGFDLATPREKSLVILLSSPKAYAAFEGQKDLDEAEGGHFDLKANWQVTFDFRSRDAGAIANAGRINTFTLVHETIHQLTFNTGVLDLASDVPVAISEGLATYAETWRPKGRGEIGQVNRLRLDGRRGSRWIPVARLVAEDTVFQPEEATSSVAYAESWLLAHWFLKDAGRVPKFRAYLDALRGRPDPKRRLEIATEHLGDLAKLDRQLQRSA